MAYEMREGQGSLFKNNKTSVNAPEWTGKLLLNGKMYRVVGWEKGPDRNGEMWLALKGELPDGSRRDDRPLSEQLDESIPF